MQLPGGSGMPAAGKKPPIRWENANVGELRLRLSTRATDTDLQAGELHRPWNDPEVPTALGQPAAGCARGVSWRRKALFKEKEKENDATLSSPLPHKTSWVVCAGNRSHLF